MNENAVKILEQIAGLLRIKGESRFKIQAYERAAEKIKDGKVDVENEIKNGSLGDVPGFGKALVSKLTELYETGKIEFFENLKKEYPESLVELTTVNGLGPKKVRALFDELGVKDLAGLEKICDEGKLQNVKGFTAKSQETILNSLSHKKANKGKARQNKAREYSDKIIEGMQRSDAIADAAVCGELRRFANVVETLEFLASARDENAARKAVESGEIAALVDELKSKGLGVKFHFAAPKDFHWKTHELSGAKEYMDAFYNYIENQGYKLSGARPEAGGESLEFDSEAAVFEKLDLQFIEPELRENAKAVDVAKTRDLPELIELSDMRGMLHCHSKWSDGKNTIEEMALESKRLGFEYFAICDHSRSAGYAHGLDVDRVTAQQKEIDALNEKKLGIRVLKGIESDILNDGSLDYPDDILASFEFIVASLHSNFKMTKSEMTKRVVSALKNPYMDALGHPTGRLLLSREPYEIDVMEVLRAAAGEGKVIEINCNPYRLDLDWRYVQKGLELGLRFSIDPDAHKAIALADVALGVRVARKGWLRASDVINCLSCEEFLREFAK